VPAIGVRASDTCNSLAVVAAGEETCRNTGDPLEAEGAQVFRIAHIVLRHEVLEMITEYMLQGVGAPQAR
jgi:hypothetical protein